MSKWYHDSSKLKEVFDCITNYVLCGVVFYTGVYSVVQESEFLFFRCGYIIFGVIFIALSLYLFYANYSYIKHKVIKLYEFKGIKFHVLNILLSITLGFGCALLFGEALKIEVNGKPIGKQTPMALLIE
ncbi:TPA: hypothetical protein NJ921_002193 [Vibrio parahaemolyticus]|uniref:hypothetical protein n=1 Tax=Vibrio parahaemolyticus TaxID=670 RepID=UPI001120D07E|nr:hypothetical protein [Vibrio parahaemolyticus]EIZ0690087.1 hypothetical protein [Vibrio parahaemolyticus]ELB2229691.1 hypothetical protein [Vibrio parahaemolyticus]MBM4986302.1 hypothetical protein [Vibrio parahaemolyticus]MCG6508333.1 hypothetical protein [Vibrio parahaemolyticus]TOI34310.1 hypothetical protein CGI61_23450 [Vibrio parahaemolyticus]